MKKLPHSLEAEQAVLGTLLVYPEVAITVAQYGLTSRDFYRLEHQRIFSHMKEIIDNNQTLDTITLVTRLKDFNQLESVGDIQYLTELTRLSGTPTTLATYVDIVQEKSQKRTLIDISERIASEGFDESSDVQALLDRAQRDIQIVAENRRTEEMLVGKDVVDQVFEQIKDFSARGSRITGLDTGYKDLNNLTNGLQNGDLIILAARPSVGKTAFALNLAMNVAQNNHKGKASVAIFSLEMPATHLITRMLSAQSDVAGTHLRHGVLTAEEWNKLNQGVGLLRTRNLYIDDNSTISVSEMFAKCRKLKNEGNLDMVVVDYIQLISGRHGVENRQQEVSEISRSLKQMARELEVPVVALSQLSRLVERRDGNMPQLSDLRESGSLEQDADIVMFLYREAYHDQESKNTQSETEMSKLLIRKHRNGAIGDIELVFSPKINRFHTFSPKEQGVG